MSVEYHGVIERSRGFPQGTHYASRLDDVIAFGVDADQYHAISASFVEAVVDPHSVHTGLPKELGESLGEEEPRLLRRRCRPLVALGEICRLTHRNALIRGPGR